MQSFNNSTIKLNQNYYRNFRCDPPNIPFNSIFIDYIGPFTVKSNNQNCKINLLCITCMFSRAVNLVLCADMTVNSFLRTFQLYCFEYGVPVTCYSDQGSQIIAGANIITDFLKDTETQSYFRKSGVKSL